MSTRLSAMIHRCYSHYEDNYQPHQGEYKGISVAFDIRGVIRYYKDGEECTASDALDYIDDREN